MTSSLVRRLDAAGLDLRAWSEGTLPAVQSVPEEAAPALQEQADTQRRLQEEWERHRERGYQAGFAEGKSAASRQAQEELATAKKRLEAEHATMRDALEREQCALKDLIMGLEQALPAMDRLAEEAAVQAGYAALIRMLGIHAGQGELMGELCRQALVDAGGEAHVLWVCAQDRENLDESENMELRIDPALKPGQLRLQSRLGHYDTGLDVRLEQIKQAFLIGLATHRFQEAK